jgi:nucleoside-diphosphate-sugar epimerase
VTGAGGFVGGHLCSLLVERGWNVLAAQRRMAIQASGNQLRPERLDLCSDPDRWLAALRSVDCVVHLAARVHVNPATQSEDEFNATNVEGSRFVAERCVAAGVRRIVFLSSIKVNGEGGTLRAARAEDIPNPQDPYARSKLAAEIAIRTICEAAGMEFVIVRPPLIYGPGVRANFDRLMRIIELGVPLPFASIDNRRSLIGVQNLVSFIETCMTHPRATGGMWLVSDSEAVSTPTLIRKLAHGMQRPAKLFACPPKLLRGLAALAGRGAEVARLCDSFILDSSPARETLGWQAPMSLDAGLLQVSSAFRQRLAL